MIKNSVKYVQMKKFNHEYRLKFYTFTLMYVYPETITEEDYLPDTK